MATTAAPTYRNLRVEHRGAVTVMFVNRPDKLNALNRETLGEIERCAREFRADSAQGALVVTGDGERSFISGADIEELAVLDPPGAEEISRFGQRVLEVLERAPKPVIAAVNGYAFGGGCELALACHMRLASENAVFGLPEVSLGILPGYGGTQRLPRLVNRVVPLAQLLEDAVKLAESIIRNGPLAVAAVLEAVNRGLQLPLDAGLRIESAQFGTLAASEDMHEGLKAFLEKRPARFQGR